MVNSLSGRLRRLEREVGAEGFSDEEEAELIKWAQLNAHARCWREHGRNGCPHRNDVGPAEGEWYHPYEKGDLDVMRDARARLGERLSMTGLARLAHKDLPASGPHHRLDSLILISENHLDFGGV